MKKYIITAITLYFLVTGVTLADPGMKPVDETQGIKVSTSVQVVGRITSEVTMDWRTSNEQPLTGEDSPPPLAGDGSAVYSATYSEDTISTGQGILAYDTSMDIETGAVTTPLSNIKAEKEIFYATTNGGSGRIYSSSTIFVGGSGLAATGENVRSICPFTTGNQAGVASPAFSNSIEMGSTIDMDYANVVTRSDARFITVAADFPVEVNHAIAVGTLGNGVPSSGTVSAFTDAVIREGRDESTGLYEEIKFSESTSFSGDIEYFIKAMHYESGPTR